MKNGERTYVNGRAIYLRTNPSFTILQMFEHAWSFLKE
jgi:hypothetical protein